MANLSSRKAFAAHSSKPKQPPPSPLKAYIKADSASQEIKAYVQFMEAWKTEIHIISNLSERLPDDAFKNLVALTKLFRETLPTISLACESLYRRHPKAYKEFADLVGLGVKFNAYGIIRQQKHKPYPDRYGLAIKSITDILSYPIPADREDTPLPPRHIDQGSYLEGVLSDSIKDISKILFLQMRVDGLNDQVDFLAECTARVLAKDTRFMKSAHNGMESAFLGVYNVMTDDEKSMLSKSRFTIGCKASQDIICELIRENLIVDTKGYEQYKRTRQFA